MREDGDRGSRGDVQGLTKITERESRATGGTTSCKSGGGAAGPLAASVWQTQSSSVDSVEAGPQEMSGLDRQRVSRASRFGAATAAPLARPAGHAVHDKASPEASVQLNSGAGRHAEAQVGQVGDEAPCAARSGLQSADRGVSPPHPAASCHSMTESKP